MNIVRLIFLFVLGYIVSYLYRKLWKGKSNFIGGNKKNSSIKPEEMKQDPVCKTYVPKSQAIKYTDKKETIYFCSEKCKNKFIEEKK